MPAVQLVLLSVVILTCLQTGVAHDNDDIASMISAAVHEILLPIMKEIKNDLNSVKNDLEDYKQQTASELAGLQSSVTSAVISTCTDLLPRDCCQIKIAHSSAETGLYEIIDPSAFNYDKIHVHCDMETDGGGWIVIQRRIANGTVNFTRNWENYKNGFGDLYSEFWIGLNNIYQLTNQQEMELHISVWNNSETSITWNYQTFRISDSADNYRLTVGNGTGDSYRDTLAYNNGHYFSTYDRNRRYCGYGDQGGWWYSSCTYANLNGRHESSGLPGTRPSEELLIWNSGGGHKVYTNSVMMIRSKTCGLTG